MGSDENILAKYGLGPTLKKIEMDAKCADELICKLASGKEKWSMSVPPQDFDTDMVLIRQVREHIPFLLGLVLKYQKFVESSDELIQTHGDFHITHHFKQAQIESGLFNDQLPRS